MTKRIIKSFISFLLILSLALSMTFEMTMAQNLQPNSSSINSNEKGKLKRNTNNETSSRFIIKYKDASAKDKVGNTLKNKVRDIKKIQTKDNMSMELVFTNKSTNAADLLMDIKNSGLEDCIEYIQPDYQLTSYSNDTYFDQQWGLKKPISSTTPGGSSFSVAPSITTPAAEYFSVNSPSLMGANVIEAWESAQGENVLVALIDTGVDIEHEDLKDNIFINPNEIAGNGIDDDNNGYVDDINGWNFYNNNSIVNSTSEQHGTHIAGIISGIKDNQKGIAGVAPKSKILPLAAFENGYAYTSDIIEAIDYAENMGAKIVNCSWGATEDNTAMQDALQNSNMLFVCASGNNGVNLDQSPLYPASFEDDNIVAVASINKYGMLAETSNFGVTGVDVAAPGEEIISTLPGNNYANKSGTSMATAFVSGEAALIYSKYPDMDVQSVKSVIIDTSVTSPSLTGVISSGGIIDCGAALDENNWKLKVKPKVKGVTPDASQYIKVITSIKSFASADKKQLKIVSDFLGIDSKLLLDVEKQGYSIADTILVAKIILNTELKYDEIKQALKNYSDLHSLYVSSNQYKNLINSRKYSKKVIAEIKQLLILGCNMLEIERPSVVADKFSVSLSEIIKRENEDIIESVSENSRSSKEMEQLYSIASENGISPKWLFQYAKKMKVSYDEFNKMVKEYYSISLDITKSNDIEQTTQSAASFSVPPQAAMSIQSIQEEDKFKAPFSYEEYNDDKVERNTGSLIIENTDVHLAGKNGLDLNIISRYDSDEDRYSEFEAKIITDLPTRYDVYIMCDRYTAQGQIYLDKLIFGSYYNIPLADYMRLREIYENNEVYQYNKDEDILYKFSVQKAKEYTQSGYYNFQRVYDYTPTYNQVDSPLGNGWGFVFDSIEVVESGSYYNNYESAESYYLTKSEGRFLHLATGECYKIKDDLKLDGYKLNDIQLKLDSTYTNGQNVKSYYALVYKDGIRKYFSYDGRLLATKDRYNNIIQYQHTNIRGHNVITKIIDTLGREITINYDFTNHKVVVSAPDNYKVTYNLTDFGGIRDEEGNGDWKYKTYRVQSRVDACNRTTAYEYSGGVYRRLLCSDNGDLLENASVLTKVNYHTGMSVVYNYTTVGRYISAGYEYYPRVNKRTVNNKSGTVRNYYEYGYTGSYTGYPFKQEEVNLYNWLSNYYSPNYKFTIASMDCKAPSIEYEFDKENLNIGQKTYRITGRKIKPDESFSILSTLLFDSTEYKYNSDTDKQLKQKIYKTYTVPGFAVPNTLEKQNLNKYIQKVEDYNYDSYGNLVKYWGPEASRDSSNQLINAENDPHKVLYTYDTASYNLLLTSEYKKDAATTIKQQYTPTGDRKGISETIIQENGMTKSKSQYGYDQWGNITSEALYTDVGSSANLVTKAYSYQDNDPTSHSGYNFNGAYLTQKSVTGILDADGTTGTINEDYYYDVLGNLMIRFDPKDNPTSFQYDLLGRKQRETNPDNTSAYYTYDDTNNILNVKNEKGIETKYIYDEFGDLIYEKDVASGQNLKEYHYNEYFKLDWETNNTSGNDYHRIDYAYNDDESIKSKTTVNKNGSTIAQEKYLYDNAFDMDGDGKADYSKSTKQVIGDSQSPTIVTTQYMNNMGQLKREGRIFAGEEYYATYNYDFAGNRIEEKSARAYKEGWTQSFTTKYEYDYAGRLTKTQDIQGNISTVTYDAAGRAVTKTDNKGNLSSPKYSTSYSYDAMGRVVQEKTPFEIVGTTVYYTVKKNNYDANGNIVLEKVTCNKSGQAALYKQTGYEYDSRNRLVKVTTYNNGTPVNFTQYYYDAVGNKLRMYTGLKSPLTISGLDDVTGSDMDFSETKYLYDGFNQLTEMTDPLKQKESYTYDYNGNMTGKVDRNGNVLTMIYDGLNRITSRSVVTPDGSGNKTYSYSYTLTGNKLSSAGEGMSTSYLYDELGRLVKETETGGIEKSYTYDASNNRKSFTLTQNGTPRIVTTYEYDNMNRLWKVSENGAIIATYGYDENGNRKSLVYTNGDSTDYLYNLSNKLTSLTNKKGSTVLSSYLYAYYLDGNQASKTDNTGSVTNYTYDGLGRLTSEAVTGESTISYTYDDGNNRHTMTVGSAVTTYNNDKNNRLTTEVNVDNGITKTTRYSYDNNGNQIYKDISTIKPVAQGETESISAMVPGEGEDGSGVTVSEYDGFNQLVKVSTGNSVAEYTYNQDGLRTSKTVNGIITKQVWDGDQIALELINGTATNKYLRGINLIAEDIGGVRKYALFNGHGDVVGLTDTSGNMVKSYQYDAFGNEKKTDPNESNPLRYIGEALSLISCRNMSIGTVQFTTEVSYTPTTIDPTIEFSVDSIEGEYATITLQISANENSTGQIFWRTAGGTFSETNSKKFSITAGTNQYTVQLGRVTAGAFRLDVGMNGSPVTLRNIKLIVDKNLSSATYRNMSVSVAQFPTEVGYTPTSIDPMIEFSIESIEGDYPTVTLQITANENSTGQIFWKTVGGSFSETNSKKFAITAGTKQYTVELGQVFAGVLRLDVGVNGSPVTLRNIKLNINKIDTNPFRYSGEYFDKETGTYYLRARYYDPVIGRFITEDSYLGEDNDPLSLNLYTYCANNPIMYFDQDGHCFMLITMGIGALAGGIIGGAATAITEYVTTGEVNWKDVGVSAIGGAVTGAMAGSGLGLVPMIAGNAAVSAGTYVLTEKVNGRTATASGVATSAFLGAGAGLVGGSGAYPSIKAAVDSTTKSVIPQFTKGAVTALTPVTKSVVEVAKQQATAKIVRLTTVNAVRTVGGNIVTNSPTIVNSIKSSVNRKTKDKNDKKKK